MSSSRTDDPFGALSPGEAERVVEKLRFGVPPPGLVRQFTVGRQDELAKLESRLQKRDAGGGLLLHADYGSGKTHLLRLIQDMAVNAGFCVSFVEVSSQHGIRFNRMDLVLGAVCRALQTPDGLTGLRPLFEKFSALDGVDDELRDERDAITSDGRWDYSDALPGEALYIALRAFCVADDDDVKDLAVEFLSTPDRYRTQRKRVREDLIDGLYLNEPRNERQLYRALTLAQDDYEGVWTTLNGLDELARLCGYRGMVLLFDEFEDVITNINNRSYTAAALHNLFDFFIGRYGGGSFFAVTPEFSRKAQDLLLMKGLYDFPFRRLDELERFQLSPISFEEMLGLSARILAVHAQAYEWQPEETLDFAKVAKFLVSQWQENAPERVRIACRALIDLLDEELERIEG